MFTKNYFKVAVIGLGYVGLPLYISLQKKKIDTIGLDQDSQKIKSLNINKSYNSDVSDKTLKNIKDKKFFDINKYNNISDRNAIIFCLPTPLKNSNQPDLSYIINAFNKIKNSISDDTILILESTVYPGATKEIFKKFIENKKFKPFGVDYAYSSERISPGQSDQKKFKIKFDNIDKVISANNNRSRNKVRSLYSFLFKKIYMAKSVEIAETSKLLENTYRAVNIGLVNEFKKICYSLKLNINDIIDTASSKPFGFTPFRPGPGVGGHCIPIDPVYLSWIAKKNNQKAKFIDLARKTNLEITNWVFNKILLMIKKKNAKKILMIGITYKEDVNDLRESPLLKIYKKLGEKKIELNFYDPHISSFKIGNKIIKGLKKLVNLRRFDICILGTAHSNLDYSKILKESKTIIDTRGKFNNIKRENILQL
jgi:UDP-N-acetyl-D-glucosamine dehydrogenase